MQDTGITSSLTRAEEERAILPSTRLANIPPSHSHARLHPGAVGKAPGQPRAVPLSPRDKHHRCPQEGCSLPRSSHGRQVPRDLARSWVHGSNPSPSTSSEDPAGVLAPLPSHSTAGDQPPTPQGWAASWLLSALSFHLPFQVQPLQRQPVGFGWQEMRRPVGRMPARSSAHHPKPRHGEGG